MSDRLEHELLKANQRVAELENALRPFTVLDPKPMPFVEGGSIVVTKDLLSMIERAKEVLS